MEYTKKKWFDHIVDESTGAVIQQGTPVNAANLNNIEDGEAWAKNEINNLAGAVREAIPSGFTKFSGFDFSYMTANQNNKIKLTGGGVAMMNGYKIEIPDGTVITMPDPPATGERDDVVFLEAWLDQATDTEGVKPNWRIRVLPGVDFATYPIDGFFKQANSAWSDNNAAILPQGGNVAPVSYVIGNVAQWSSMQLRNITGIANLKVALKDVGVYVAGDGTQTAKDTLNTSDGYVYAIPMFRIRRRNKLQYSAQNPNGGIGDIATSYEYIDDTHYRALDHEGNELGIIEILTLDNGVTDVIDVVDGLLTKKVKPYTLQGSDYITTTTSQTYVDYAVYKMPSDCANLGLTGTITGQVYIPNKTESIYQSEIPTAEVGKFFTGNASGENRIYFIIEKGTVATARTEIEGILALNYQLAVEQINPEINSISDWHKRFVLGARIIDDRDIIDLRHQVSLTGFNYQQLLEENFDKLLRGELQTKERKRRLKVYHGIRKTPIDANTVFYASLDGTTTAEVGGELTVAGSPGYKPSPTGGGLKFNHATNTTRYSISNVNEKITVDFWVNYEEVKISTSDIIMKAWDAAGNSAFLVSFDSNKDIQVRTYRGSTGDNFSPYDGLLTCKIDSNKQPFIHVRVTINGVLFKAYINGKELTQISSLKSPTGNINRPTQIDIAETIYGVTISDMSVSNIDRGDEFATLPKDFIAGYARIMPAMTGQRKTLSDAITGQYTTGVAKGTGSGHSKGVTVTQATPGTWAAGDTIKVKGLAGELISGVIDSDTILARVTAISGTTVTLDSVTGLANSDTVKVLKADGTVTSDITISALDTTAKTATFSSVTGIAVGDMVVETTASSSSPVVKFMSAGTLTAVTGTWAGLGTNEATFTLGTNASLVNADIQIEYSLDMPAGQGGIAEVYTATLAGEAKGKKLVPGTVAVQDDFVGKVVGSTTENPNLAKKIAATTLQAPTNFSTEFDQAGYDTSEALDGTTSSITTSVNGEIPQQLFSFDLVKMIEEKYGTIPAVDKVGWLETNIVKITPHWYGYGIGPNGYKVYVAPYYNNAWGTPASHSYGQTALLTISAASIPALIDSDGTYKVIVYTDASNGTTASTIYTDYVSIDIELTCPTGYDMLVPENPRRDDGAAAVLLVRKATKEIQSYFNVAETDGLITYGDFVPKQADTLNIGKGTILTTPMAFFTTLGTTNPAPSANLISNFDLLNEFAVNTPEINSIYTDGGHIYQTPVSESVADHTVRREIQGTNKAYENFGAGREASFSLNRIQTIVGQQYYYAYFDMTNVRSTAKYKPLVAMLVKDTTGQLYMVLLSVIGTSNIGLGMDNSSGRGIMFSLNKKPLLK
ncbi:hypothetical protein [Petroclostridium sp. X23]|uniref:hypothetical protein n=1 Tax=Petroclostridium sp. X23 TaxID=3045146 RepID=UPI0024AE4EB8|nr:hypothetical protein [Petroclostridium sp. X23]WHH58321.1 hypothetical protein QKW49_21355 [Petroclostridium sp. X23]